MNFQRILKSIILLSSIEEGCYKKTIGQCANNDVEGDEAITMFTWFFMNNYTRCDKGRYNTKVSEKRKFS